MPIESLRLMISGPILWVVIWLGGLFSLVEKSGKIVKATLSKEISKRKSSGLEEKIKFFLDKKKGKAYNKINHQKSNNFSTFREPVVGGNR